MASNHTGKVDGCYMTAARQQNSREPVLIAYKGSNAHILYRNESKQRAFSEPKFYPDFWVITMGIGKAQR
jgi:hypothetical protein